MTNSPIAADGLFTPDVRFHCMPAEDHALAIELFGHRYLHALRNRKYISPSRLAEYLLRHPFSLQKITWNPTTQTVIYRSKRHHTTKRNFEIFRAPDFIAASIRHRDDVTYRTTLAGIQGMDQ